MIGRGEPELGVSRERIAEIKSREDVRFATAHAKSLAALGRARVNARAAFRCPG